MTVADLLLALALALIGPGAPSDHLPAATLSALNDHFEHQRIEAERHAAERERAAQAQNQRERRERERRACMRSATVSKGLLDTRLRQLGRARQFHVPGESSAREVETLNWLLFGEWSDRAPTCQAFEISPNPWLYEEISYAEAVDLIYSITAHYDQHFSSSLTDHITIRPGARSNCRGAVACEISAFRGDRALRSTIQLPNPVPRYVALHELAHSLAHLAYGRSAEHTVKWLAWQINVLEVVGLWDRAERCPWFRAARIHLPMCASSN